VTVLSGHFKDTVRNREAVLILGPGSVECLKRLDEDPDDISNLHAVCIHCVRRLRRRFDPNYDPELDANIDLGN
jgi:hypothetical protein